MKLSRYRSGFVDCYILNSLHWYWCYGAVGWTSALFVFPSHAGGGILKELFWVLGVVIMVFHCPLWHWLPVAGLMCDTLVRVLFLSPAARGGWFSVTLEMASGRPSPLLVDSFTLLSRFILLSSVVRLESVVAVAAANDAAVSVNSTVGLLLSLKTGGEVAGEGWVCWVGLMLLRPWSDASALNSCSMENMFDMVNCVMYQSDVMCAESVMRALVESPKKAVGYQVWVVLISTWLLAIYVDSVDEYLQKWLVHMP